MNRLIIIFMCVFSSLNSHSQIDSLRVIDYLKFLVIPEIGVRDSVSLQELIDKKIKITKLNSNGFGRTKFYNIKYDAFLKPESDLRKDSIKIFGRCDYTVAVYGGNFYRLGGFINTDFYQFVQTISETSDWGLDFKNIMLTSKSNEVFLKKIKQNNIFIDFLDISCYYQYYLIQRVALSNEKVKKCINGCGYLDRKSIHWQ